MRSFRALHAFSFRADVERVGGGDLVSLLRLVMAAALAGALTCAAPRVGAAESARAAAVAVDNVDVEQVAELGAGVPLVFTVFGTPQALATVRIDGARRVLELRETDPGIYEGTYVIDSRDAIRADSRVTATLQRQGAVGHARLDEPLLLARGAGALEPRRRRCRPQSHRRRRRPRRSRRRRRRCPSRSRSRRSTRCRPPPRSPPPRADSREPCADCAIVESVQAVAGPPRGGVIGAVGGAIAGAILGKELGEAHTRRVLSVLGAIGGALAGREIEMRATASTQYDVVLRLADGTRLKRRYEQAPPFVVGETLRLGASAGRSGPVATSF